MQVQESKFRETELENELVKFAQEAEMLYLFGVGQVGRLIFLLLNKVYGIDIAGFVSTFPCDAMYYGKKIYSRDVLEGMCGGTRVVVCMTGANLRTVECYEQIYADERYWVVSDSLCNWLSLKYRNFYEEPMSAYFSADNRFAYYDYLMPPTEKSCEWLSTFIRFHFPQYKEKINFFTVYGCNKYIKLCEKKNKIFYSAEAITTHPDCVWNPRFSGVDHNLEFADISLGFEYIEHPVYLRLPFWVFWLIEPTWNLKEIRKQINKLNQPLINKKREKDCVCICSHDRYSTRGPICDALENAGVSLSYGGKWCNNTQNLWNEYRNDKHAYIQNFKFNVCPENINSSGYCSEKVVHAIMAGCIPVYFGCDNRPEPEVLCQDAIIFFDPKNTIDTQKAAKRVKELIDFPSRYDEFVAQKVFTDTAADWIFDTISDLHKRIEQMIKS